MDEVIQKLDALKSNGLRGTLLLVDLHRIATGHPNAAKVLEMQKSRLQEAELLGVDGTVSQIVKDVIASSTIGEEMSLVYTGKPYIQELSTDESAVGKDSDDSFKGLMDEVFRLLSQSGLSGSK